MDYLPSSLPRCTGRILLLQGPAGPFFKYLQCEFEAKHFAVKRVLFHRADRLFSGRGCTYQFSGDAHAWQAWLRSEFTNNKPDYIVLFGSSRPVHLVARKIAAEFGIDVISLEEGYLRAGYITCEAGGNNQYSPLHHWNVTRPEATPHGPVSMTSSFVTMCFWQALYHLWRELSQSKIEQALYHQTTGGLYKEVASWTRHTCRRFIAKFSDREKIINLQKKHAGDYVLIPLQTPSDAQIKTAGRGWTNEKLITQALQSLANAPTGSLIKSTAKPLGNSEKAIKIINRIPRLLVFKTHPLDPKSHHLVSLIKQQAQALNLNDRVMVLESGKIGALTQHATGMIVINSTSAFSALHHRVPLLVLGDAIFRHPAVATNGENIQAITRFFTCRMSKQSTDIDAFIETVKAHALLPGDFYARKTQRATARHIVTKAQTKLWSNESMLEAMS